LGAKVPRSSWVLKFLVANVPAMALSFSGAKVYVGTKIAVTKKLLYHHVRVIHQHIEKTG